MKVMNTQETTDPSKAPVSLRPFMLRPNDFAPLGINNIVFVVGNVWVYDESSYLTNYQPLFFSKLQANL